MDQQADEVRWVEQARTGDQRAFGCLVERYAGAVYNQAYRMLNNAQDAEDAVQEIFLRAYTRLESFDTSRRFITWLLAIGSNYCIDRLRRRRFAWLTLDDVAFWLPSSRAGPEGSALEQERRDLVQQALQQLPEHYRMITILRYWYDLSYDEIAETTGLSDSAVKTRLHRARKMLAEALGDEGVFIWDAETTAN
ncbi:MAG: sigma-70 family RNA polymerase sigma factor [Chloroflexales bacterium]|nr:sigma-70 family RNA polymerase sigma factor [Chloroflexales bacterium]